ncbi:hypothetical protein [Nocardia nova]|uniref:hypothetical protein n=1 Tax=Nocardia nova TaxID=37330 RepID=UPI0034D7188B
MLLPRVLVQLNRDPLLAGDLFPGEVLVAALRVDRKQRERDRVARSDTARRRQGARPGRSDSAPRTRSPATGEAPPGVPGVNWSA